MRFHDNSVHDNLAQQHYMHQKLHKTPCTNNAMEGQHNAFTRAVGIVHPAVEKLVSKLQEQDLS